jgi:hypothetical protein
MVQRGRPTSAVSIVHRLKGTPVAKERVLVILENLGGTLPFREACLRIHASRTLLRRQREAMLQAALRALEPRPPGRPAREIAPESRTIRLLQSKIERLEEDLSFSRVREELALLVPRAPRRQKKIRTVPPFWRATMPPKSPDGSSDAGTPGPGSPGGWA